MKKYSKNTIGNNGGITLIALVITIIVLLILVGITIATLTGENGVLNQAGNAKAQTSHTTVYEQLIIETQGYYADYTLNSSQYNTLIEYLQSKGIIDENNVVNVEKLLGSKQSLGNGTIETGDVYVLEENTEVSKVASVGNNFKIAETTSSSTKQYKLMYYDTNLEISQYIGLVPGFGEVEPVDESKLYYGDSSIEPTDQKYFDWTLDTDTMTATLNGINQQYRVVSYYNDGSLDSAIKKTSTYGIVGIIDENGNAIKDIVIPYSVTYEGKNYVVSKIGSETPNYDNLGLHYAFYSADERIRFVASVYGYYAPLEETFLGTTDAYNTYCYSSFTIPSTVKYVGSYAFQYNPASNIYLSPNCDTTGWDANWKTNYSGTISTIGE